MKEKIKEVIVKSINEINEIEVHVEDISGDEVISELQINSITFIKMVVFIEEELDIELDDEHLNLEKYKTLNDFIDYLAECIDE